MKPPANFTLLLQLLLQKKPDQQGVLELGGDLGFSGRCGPNVYERDTCVGPEEAFQGLGLKPGMRVNGRSKRNSLICPKWLWPDGLVPYRLLIDNPLILDRFQSALAEIQMASCVRFLEAAEEDKRVVEISESEPIPGKRCKATVGLTRPNPYVHLSTACTRGQILHELMHVLGFAHEHMRPDRGEYVDILCENIMTGLTTDFRRLRPGIVTQFQEPYDFYSIMHYRLDHFSVNGRPTIRPKVNDLLVDEIGRMDHLSAADIRKLNQLYQCD